MSAADKSKRPDAFGKPDGIHDSRVPDAPLDFEDETLESGTSMRVPSTIGFAATAPSSGPAENVRGPAMEQPGQMIGRYKLLQEIGEGGFGVVYVAEQEQPVRRRVALKIIKPGMDTRQVIARFEAERQALALMDHPNIAKVLDAGATDSGRPYFVMELVKGIPITEYCNNANMPFRRRLELFVQVCGAVQHAHQKGIIHRDIKPSNVLVTHVDDKSAPKVIDFGIAKATQARLTAQTVYTEIGQFIGTPAYMSPEQADPLGVDIDTRSDIYSLGVLLYELLTGATPIDGNSLRVAGLDEIQRMVRSAEPPRPSLRLRSPGIELDTIARQRSIEPKKLFALLRGDLDWIVMRALEKDRARRYETAGALALDIGRYLTGEPVAAAPPSASYQLQKFIARNRGAVTAGGAVAAALLIGVVAFAWQATVARDQRDRALEAEAATKASAAELKLVSDFQAGMLEQIDPTRAGEDLTADVTARFAVALARASPPVPESERPAQVEAFKDQWRRVNATDAARELIDRTILRPAIKMMDTQFRNQPVVDAQLRQTMASRYVDLGLYDSALPLQERAMATRRRVLGEDHPDTLESITGMGALLYFQGRPAEAEPYWREALEKRRRVLGEEHVSTLTSIDHMGLLLTARGKLAEAEPYYREALEKRRRVLGEEHPVALTSIGNLGSLLLKQGKLREAEPYFRETLAKTRRALGEDHKDTLIAISGMGGLLSAQGRLTESEPYYREALEKSRRLLGEEHPDTLIAINNMGRLLFDQGKLVEAEPYYREALEKRRRVLGADHPDTLNSYASMNAVIRFQGKLAEAEPFYRASLEQHRRVLGEDHPSTLVSLSALGGLLYAQGKLAEAEPYLREALEKRRRVLGEDHPNTLTAMSNVAALLQSQGKLADAEAYVLEALAKCRAALGDEHPTTLKVIISVGRLRVAQGQDGEAVALLAPIEGKVRNAFTGTNASWVALLLTNLGKPRAQLARDHADFAAAESNLLEAHAIYAKTAGATPKDTRDCTQAVADLFAAWDKSEPGTGYAAKAAEWKAAFEVMNASTPANTPTPAHTHAPAKP